MTYNQAAGLLHFWMMAWASKVGSIASPGISDGSQCGGVAAQVRRLLLRRARAKAAALGAGKSRAIGTARVWDSKPKRRCLAVASLH